MSRVFVAEEKALGRKVVVKVLPPEMAAGVNVDRFRREIQLAASLQHPHIVPLHAASQVGDLFYYTMPLVEGESLRARLAREGELPIPEALRILREVADALSYAHKNGVVHRDIKPDNVLLSGGHAVVTDFGVAKAVTAASGGSSLTSLGVALGTPAYMAPEQAAADPHVDHRADLYALGVLAYETLTGAPPFTGMSPQQVLAAHVTQAPEPLAARRPACPPALNALIMRCLEKRPADRWQSASELVAQLDGVITPTGGMTPTGTSPAISSGTEKAIRIADPLRVTALFIGASLVILALVYGVVLLSGLPDWVVGAAAVLLLLGLPIMLLTARHERGRAVARTTSLTTPMPATGVTRLFTWRRAILGGGLAFAALGVATIGYTAMRLLGIGSVGTLMASGAIGNKATLLLADFTDRTGDSTLASALTEAIRVDLSQSKVVRLLSPGDVRAALDRMRRPEQQRLDPATARELAVREGAGAIVAGEINRAGSGFVLSSQLLSPDGSQVLAAFRETAADGNGVIPAINKLSRSIRAKIGESFKTLRAQGSLAQVTTGSLDAIRKYSLGLEAEQRGDLKGAEQLFSEAVALDSNFAMAWRKLGVVISNGQGLRSRWMSAAERAYALRDRLPELEKYQTSGFWLMNTSDDPSRSVALYNEALARFPDDPTLLANGALGMRRAGRYAEAESLASRGHAYGYAAWSNQIWAQLDQGHLAAAESTLMEVEKTNPQSPNVRLLQATVAWAGGKYRAADSVVAGSSGEAGGDPAFRGIGLSGLTASRALEGRLGESRTTAMEAIRVAEARGVPTVAINVAVVSARAARRYGLDPSAADRAIEDLLARYPLKSLAPPDRPYPTLIEYHAEKGDVATARRLMAEYDAAVPDVYRRGDRRLPLTRAVLALAEKRPGDAVSELEHQRELNSGGDCQPCLYFLLGEAYDAAGSPDSAIGAWDRALGVGTPAIAPRMLSLPHAYQRLGEIYEQRGDRAKAIDYYGRLAKLWKDADAPLQPVVKDMKERMTRLAGEP